MVTGAKSKYRSNIDKDKKNAKKNTKNYLNYDPGETALGNTMHSLFLLSPLNVLSHSRHIDQLADFSEEKFL